jgi:hypothetical protein
MYQPCQKILDPHIYFIKIDTKDPHLMKNVKVVDVYRKPHDDKTIPDLQPKMRKGPKDGRILHTYIANNRRSGLADRRKRPVIDFADRRSDGS